MNKRKSIPTNYNKMDQEMKKRLLHYESDKNVFLDFLTYHGEVTTANVGNNYEHEHNLRDSIRVELIDIYFEALYTKLMDYFQVQHPELKYDFRNANIFESGYKGLLFTVVAKPLTEELEKLLEVIPDVRSDKCEFRINFISDGALADKRGGLKVTPMVLDNGMMRYYLSLTREEVNWFIDEQLDDSLAILEEGIRLDYDKLVEKVKNQIRLKTRSAKDAQIIELTLELKSAKDPLLSYTTKEAIADAIRELNIDPSDDKELKRIENIYNVEMYKRNRKK